MKTACKLSYYTETCIKHLTRFKSELKLNCNFSSMFFPKEVGYVNSADMWLLIFQNQHALHRKIILAIMLT